MMIYLVISQTTGKKYVGASRHKLSRVRHRLATDARRFPTSPDNSLRNDVARYGIENFSFAVLEEVAHASFGERLNYWISYYSSLKPNGYNNPYQPP